MDTIGPWELLFAADRLPQMASSLGEGIREFRSAVHESSQTSNPDATHGPGIDSPPER